MRKILMGLMAIVLIAGVTTAAGYAVFTATATVNNIAFTSGTAGLEFSTDNSSWSSNLDYGATYGWFEQNVYPGFSDTKTIYLYNNSTSNISLDITAQLVSATGDWGLLSPVTSMTIYGQTYTLADWNGANRPLYITLAHGISTPVTVTFSVASTADNTISGKTVSTNWVFTGTQH